jgi:hypothetical protein
MNIYSELIETKLNNYFDWINPILNIHIKNIHIKNIHIKNIHIKNIHIKNIHIKNIHIQKNYEKTDFEYKLQRFKWKFAKQKQLYKKVIKIIKSKPLTSKKYKKIAK